VKEEEEEGKVWKYRRLVRGEGPAQEWRFTVLKKKKRKCLLLLKNYNFKEEFS
jgi:hypothetical protein